MKDTRIKKFKDISILTGMSLNSWFVLEEVRKPNQSQRHYLCRCACGKESIKDAQSVKSGRSRQCYDCAFKKHGLSGTDTYKIWGGMLTRCYNPKSRIYRFYGGRGISVCDRWHKFENFYEDMGARPKDLQIDRIDCNGNYEPSNCRWISKHENMLNRRPMPTLVGRKIGTWTVKEELRQPNQTHKYYKCVCDCGTTQTKCGSDLTRKKFPRCRKCAAITHREYWAKRRCVGNKA